jgi:hypothetical protein
LVFGVFLVSTLTIALGFGTNPASGCGGSELAKRALPRGVPRPVNENSSHVFVTNINLRLQSRCVFCCNNSTGLPQDLRTVYCGYWRFDF